MSAEVAWAGVGVRGEGGEGQASSSKQDRRCQPPTNVDKANRGHRIGVNTAVTS